MNIEDYETVIQIQRKRDDHAWKVNQTEYRCQEAAVDRIRGCLRDATTKDYAAWLQGFLAWGAITDYYDRDMVEEIIITDHFYVATRAFKLPSGLYRSHTLNIIVPADIDVEIPSDYGHCTIYKMSYDLYGHGWVPMYRDVARLCND